jgi:hypothetical protein
MTGGVVSLKGSSGFSSFASHCQWSLNFFLHKHNTKLHSEFVLCTQLVIGTGFWLRWETHFVSPCKRSERPGMRSTHE